VQVVLTVNIVISLVRHVYQLGVVELVIVIMIVELSVVHVISVVHLLRTVMCAHQSNVNTINI